MSVPGFIADRVFLTRATVRFDAVKPMARGSALDWRGAVKLALWSEDDHEDDWSDTSGDGFQGFGGGDGQDGEDGGDALGDLGLSPSQQCLLDCIQNCPPVMNPRDPAAFCRFVCLDRCTGILV
jgi:hypothetical protein